MNSDAFQWIMISVFGFLAVYMGYLSLRTYRKIKIKDQKWTLIRSLVLIIAALSTFEFLGGITVLFVIRYAVTLAACLIFFFSHDGIGEEGFVSGSYFYNYPSVKAYDYFKKSNHFTVIFIVEEQGRKRKFEELNKEINFDLDEEEAVLSLLKEKIAKKYRRLKK